MVEVRWAELKDMHGLSKLYKSSKPPVGRGKFEAMPFTEWVVNNERLMLVAEAGKKAIGFIVVRPKGEEASIDVFAYDKKSKTENLKEQLLERAEELIDARRMTVFVPKGDPMVRFFKNQKYETYDEIHDLYGKGKNAYLMVKDVTKGPKFRILHKKAAKVKKADVLDRNLEKLDAYLDF